MNLVQYRFVVVSGVFFFIKMIHLYFINVVTTIYFQRELVKDGNGIHQRKEKEEDTLAPNTKWCGESLSKCLSFVAIPDDIPDKN